MQISKEDEATPGSDTEVRREDQEHINRFSRLHQREMVLEDELKAKQVCLLRISRNFLPAQILSHAISRRSNVIQKDKEDLEEISNELELADEDDTVPYD